jgi:nucleotide-binding universal stress UspA family protein
MATLGLSTGASIMFSRILIPLDGSTLAERSIAHAEQFARIFGSSIVLLQVLEPTSFHENPNPVDPFGWQIRKAEADMYMHGVAARIRKNLNEGGRGNKISVEYSIREGKTAENIVDFAHDDKTDLLVISTHGAGGLSRWNISSVIQKVINLVYLPVLIVRAYNQSGTDDGRIHYRRILLPIDSSRRSEYSLSAGIALAQGETSMGYVPEAANTSIGHAAPVSL